jgi:NADH-quinone oxidoreductase subunit M
MGDWPLLSLVTFLPLVGAAFIFFIRGEPEIVARNSRSVALWTALVTFLLSLLIWANFDSSQAGFQLVEKSTWLPGLNIQYYLGVDGISLWFVLLSTLLTLVVVIGSWYSVEVRVKEYMIAFLVMDTLMVGVFCALDIVLFYVFFEGILIPMYLIIGIWGGPRRIYASFKFFLYTLLGSVLFLVAILYLYLVTGTTEIPAMTQKLLEAPLPLGVQQLLWLAMFVSFAVKVPMWPFHTWLPDAHTEAPTVGSVLLAGILLKMGTYGFIRIALPILPDAAREWAPWIGGLAAIAIVYAALACLAQRDLKRLIAFSSVGHMGFVMLAIATLTPIGINAAIFGMVAHGVITGMLFFCVGSIYDRYHTREIAELGGGLMQKLPYLGGVFAFVAIASLGLPGLAGFWGEVMALLSSYQPAQALNTALFRAFMVAGGVGTILTAGYFLWMLQRVNMGTLPERWRESALPDVVTVEWVSWLPLLLAIVALGVFPRLILGVTDGAVSGLMRLFGG